MERVSLTDNHLAKVSDMIQKRIGLHFSPEKYSDLKRGINIISKEQGFSDPSACINWILQIPVDRAHTEILATALTIGETYFFREPEVFDLIQYSLLPPLISRRRKEGKYIRIWSAGCSNGEEAYSLAILLVRSIPDIKDWSVTILAIDINPDALKRARDGIYNEWSFRSVPQLKNERFFRKISQSRYEIIQSIKDLVTFSYLNLVEDDYPSLLTNTNAMDLILCRNVLMYFSQEARSVVTNKLTNALVPDGRLVVSMTETMIISRKNLLPETHNGIIVFRKVEGEAEITMHSIQDPNATPGTDLVSSYQEIDHLQTDGYDKKQPEESPLPVTRNNLGSALKDIPKPADARDTTAYDIAARLYESGKYLEAEKKLYPLCIKKPLDYDAIALMIQVQANLGNLDGSMAWCKKAIAHDKLNPYYHLLLAAIWQEKGTLVEAKKELRRALYADPCNIAAHFSLAYILFNQGKISESELHFEHVNVLIRQFKPDEIIKGTGGMSAASLEQNIRSILVSQEVA